jgi:hypothetical protein
MFEACLAALLGFCSPKSEVMNATANIAQIKK